MEKYDNGDWHKAELIGKGSSGKVYAIAKLELGSVRYAALKVIPAHKTIVDPDSLRAEGYDDDSIREYMDEKVRAYPKIISEAPEKSGVEAFARIFPAPFRNFGICTK
jgi:hypothetical protein